MTSSLEGRVADADGELDQMVIPLFGAERRANVPTSTASFGSSRRESHDAANFYRRFSPTEISGDDSLGVTTPVDVIYPTDSRSMKQVASNSVALIVTSPPYFAGKEYEEALGVGGIPATYFEYLEMLAAVFSESKRVLEPGGRIAVNVANLGRRPFRSLSSDVIEILQGLGLLLRGEVVWWKGKAAGGSCAWGSFQRPGNPVLRDVTERVIIASKGRFDRAKSPRERDKSGLPSMATISKDEFLEATTDLWMIPSESATRVGHPAPFPVALPLRLIDLFTYKGDLVLDPFMGSGATAVAATRAGRKFVGFDTDSTYVGTTLKRVEEEKDRMERESNLPSTFRVEIPAVPVKDADGEDFQAQAVRQGCRAKELAEILLTECGFTNLRPAARFPRLGVELTFIATDLTGNDWAFDVSGAFTSSPAGLRRTDTLWKALGKAAVLHEAGFELPLVLLTTDTPKMGSSGYRALSVVRGAQRPVFDVIELLDPEDQKRLHDYALAGVSAL